MSTKSIICVSFLLFSVVVVELFEEIDLALDEVSWNIELKPMCFLFQIQSFI